MSSNSGSEAVLGVDSNGAIAVWERRSASDGQWSNGKLIEQVQDVGRVHSACLLSDGGGRRKGSTVSSTSKLWVMLCGSDRACVFDILQRCKIIVNFCAMSFQVTIVDIVIL